MRGLLNPDVNLSGLFNTQLSEAEEAAFRLQPMSRQTDVWDYDPRAAFEGGGFSAQAANGHFGDIGKKPNHPTFSDQSKWSTPAHPGGYWLPVEAGRVQNAFVPSVQMYSDEQRMRDLAKYMAGPAENGAALYVSPFIAAPRKEQK